jgi:hypothetical protein
LKKFTAVVFPKPDLVVEPVDPPTPIEELPGKIDRLVLVLDRVTILSHVLYLELIVIPMLRFRCQTPD